MGLERKIKALVLSKRLTVHGIFCLGALILATGCSERYIGPEATEKMNPSELKVYLMSRFSESDVALFDRGFTDSCKDFEKFNYDFKLDAVAGFYTSISIAESALNSFQVFPEETLGFDSLGLFSLSYEDNETYGCEFDREYDARVADPAKTIYRSDTQVDCLLTINRRLIERPQDFEYLRNLGSPAKLKVSQKLSAYWSVLRDSNERGKRDFTAATHKYLPPGC